MKRMLDPKLPTQEEVDKHWAMGHIPYRNWCHICIKAKAREDGHRRDDGKVRNLPEYSWDYCFPGDELGFKWTVLVGKERTTGSVMATTVPMKGFGTGKFSIDKCLEFVHENGDSSRDIIIKGDQENSLEHVLDEIVRARVCGISGEQIT